MSKNHKKVGRVLKYIDYLLVVTSTVTGSLDVFAFLLFLL